jgi:SAM-dependent methyltransferase
MKTSWVFDGPPAMKLTLARQALLTPLLAHLKRRLDLHSALDLGCGVGYFSTFLSGMGLNVVGVDGRAENVQEAARRFPDITFHCLDVEDRRLIELGPVDLVLCLGLLYHLENPFRAIRNLAALTGKITVIEGICVPNRRPVLELRDEGMSEDQAVAYVAFYPSESCLVKMLYRSGFAYVYRPHRLPEHENYRKSFLRRRLRTMIFASKVPLALDSLIALPEPVGSADPWKTPWVIPRGFAARLVRFMVKPWSDNARSLG